jgi:hypothetical protein
MSLTTLFNFRPAIEQCFKSIIQDAGYAGQLVGQTDNVKLISPRIEISVHIGASVNGQNCIFQGNEIPRCWQITVDFAVVTERKTEKELPEDHTGICAMLRAEALNASNYNPTRLPSYDVSGLTDNGESPQINPQDFIDLTMITFGMTLEIKQEAFDSIQQ